LASLQSALSIPIVIRGIGLHHPGNDDAIRAIQLFSTKIADAAVEGKQIYEKQLQREGAKEEKERSEKAEPPKQMQAEETAVEIEGNRSDGNFC